MSWSGTRSSTPTRTSSGTSGSTASSRSPIPGDGIALRRHDTGDLEWLAPDLRAFAVAAPGEYRLRLTGEVVSDADVLATGTLYGPASGD